MIKGRIGRSLAWLLAGVILLASCKTGRSDPPQDTAEETSGQTSSGALELIRDGTAGCGIVRQSSVGKDVMTLCSELFGAVREKTGAEIGFVSDRKTLQDGWIEILIGDTNRRSPHRQSRRWETMHIRFRSSTGSWCWSARMNGC